jgi:hypothetical protein
MTDSQQCSHCHIHFPWSDFTKNKRTKTGYGIYCKKCRQEFSRKTYEKNYEKRRIQDKEYRENNLERIKLREQKYREKNREEIKHRIKDYYNKNPEKKQISDHKNYITHRDKILKRQNEYAKKHQGEKRSYNNEYEKNRKKIDPVFAFRRRVKNLIRSSFTGICNPNEKSNFQIVGKTPKELKEHLFETFLKNYGRPFELKDLSQVHIDHIIPISTAKTKEDVIRLNHFSNLQLLLTKDNIIKGIN